MRVAQAAWGSRCRCFCEDLVWISWRRCCLLELLAQVFLRGSLGAGASSGTSWRRCFFVDLLAQVLLRGFTSRSFGNPQKALLLLSISHRWLNRLTCDIPSEEFPAGVRLTTFVRHLNEYFSTSVFGKGSGSERLSRARGSLLRGWDVIIFFRLHELAPGARRFSRQCRAAIS
jgi:hypothetical protein